MKKYITLFLVAVFSISSMNAQKKMLAKLKASAQNFISKPLVVVMKSEKKEYYTLYNQYIKEAFKSEWHLNDGIEYITEEEFKKLAKEKSTKYAYVRYHDNTAKNHHAKDSPFNEAIYFGSIEEGKSLHIEPFDLSEDIAPIDLFIALQNAQIIIEGLSVYEYEKMSMKEAKAKMAEHAKTSGILKEQTLYIPREMLAKGLEDKIADLYKYEFEIVDINDIQTAILNNYPEFYYLTKGTVYDADTGKPLVVYGLPNSKVQVQVPLVGILKTDKITEKDIKDISKMLN